MAFLLTVQQAAAHMGMSDRALYRLIRLQLFPAVHFGRGVRVHRDQMLEYLEKGGRKTRTPNDSSAISDTSTTPETVRLERAT